jgi:flagellar basal body-associated protein FliL
MDKNNNVVVNEKSSKANIVIITVAIIILITGAFGIGWYSNQETEPVVETTPEMVEPDQPEVIDEPEQSIDKAILDDAPTDSETEPELKPEDL